MGGLFLANTYIFIPSQQAAATAASVAAAYNAYTATNGMMFGFNAAHTHANPYEQVLNPSNVGALTKLWTFPPALPRSSPAVVNGGVYTHEMGIELAASGQKTNRNFSQGESDEGRKNGDTQRSGLYPRMRRSYGSP
ncbi:MAG: hypothetical protein NVS2B12_35920 [Ktedonobacteraceae bacterium]